MLGKKIIIRTSITFPSVIKLHSSLNMVLLSKLVQKLCRVVGMGSRLVGCGSAVPTLEVSNDDLAQIVETSDEWISVRTGIHNRRILAGTNHSANNYWLAYTYWKAMHARKLFRIALSILCMWWTTRAEVLMSICFETICVLHLFTLY